MEAGPSDRGDNDAGKMIVHRFVNSIFESNTYVLYCETGTGAWVIDPGDVEPVISCLEQMGRMLDGILVTHSHHDHIYGINEIQKKYSSARIFLSERSVAGLFSARLNMSRYFLRPFCVEPQEVVRIGEGSRIPVAGDVAISVVETSGHHPGSLCFALQNALFTGDSLLPGHKITTILPGGDKQLAYKSVHKLIARFDEQTRVLPGHGNECLLGAVDFDVLFQRSEHAGNGDTLPCLTPHVRDGNGEPPLYLDSNAPIDCGE